MHSINAGQWWIEGDSKKGQNKFNTTTIQINDCKFMNMELWKILKNFKYESALSD